MDADATPGADAGVKLATGAEFRPADKLARLPLVRARSETSHRSSRSSTSALPVHASYVTIPIASAITGYSTKAIRRKIEAGVWVEGREFRRAPDGHILISLRGYESWVERGRA